MTFHLWYCYTYTDHVYVTNHRLKNNILTLLLLTIMTKNYSCYLSFLVQHSHFLWSCYKLILLSVSVFAKGQSCAKWEKSITVVIFNIQNHLNSPSVNDIHMLSKKKNTLSKWVEFDLVAHMLKGFSFHIAIFQHAGQKCAFLISSCFNLQNV